MSSGLLPGNLIFLISLVFQSFLTIILRGSVSDTGYLISFFREVKRDVIDARRSFRYHLMIEVYWAYCLYCISRKWDITAVSEMLADYSDALLESSTREMLMLLEKPVREEERIHKIQQLLDENKISFVCKLDYRSVNSALKEFFQAINQTPGDQFAISFEKIVTLKENEREFVNLMKGLSNRV